MTIHRFDDISIYFHMRNHFKKLKNVKSTIISSSKGLTKQCSNISHSEKSKTSYYNEKQTKNVSSFVHHNSISRHNFTSSETRSETSVRPSSLPPRPITRRHPYETPHKLQKSRSASETPVIKPDIAPLRSGVKQIKRKRKLLGHKIVENKGKINSIIDDNNIGSIKSTQINKSPRKEISPSDTDQHSGSSKTEEQEYLQFLLRITEDIILNNYFKNEDIEKVFQNHIEINRHRLALEKMEIQIMRLASELNIPYKSSVEQFVKQRIVNTSHCTYETEYNENCECSTQRTLNFSRCVSACNSDSNEKDPQENIENMLNNSHSLGRVTECTEPTNSVDTIFNASTKFPSVTTVSSFGNIDMLPCFENNDVELTKRNANFYQTIVQDSNSATLTKFIDVSLTEKERIGCLEEDIIFKKLNKGYQFSVVSDGKDISPKSSLNLLGGWDPQDNLENSKTVLECIDTCSEKSSQKTVYLNKVSTTSFIDEKLKLNEELVVNLPSEIPEIRNESTVIQMDDKCTQVEIVYCDKECTAQENVEEEIIEDSNYIRINGPVYVKKRVLQSDGKLVLSEEDVKKLNIESLKKSDQLTIDGNLLNQHVDIEFMVPTILQQNEKYPNNVENRVPSIINKESVSELRSERSILEKTEKDTGHEEISLFNRPLNISDYSLDTYSELDQRYMKKMSYSKLLNSDYDLTPQRDSTNNADKYHHLLVDATTSISNMYLPESNLLITEDYYLMKPHSECENHDYQGCKMVTNKDYCISCNNLLKGEKYEMENCRLPEEMNESMKHFEARNSMRKNTDVTIAIDVPSTDYEIMSDISTSIEGGEISGQMYKTNETTSTSSLLGFQEENSIKLQSCCHNSKTI